MQTCSKPRVSVFALGGVLSLSCAPPAAKSPLALAVDAPPPAAGESSAASERAATSSAVVDRPELSGVFIRVADALMPLGCLRRGQEAPEEECLDLGNAEPVSLYPPLVGERATVRAKRDAIYMAIPQDRLPGLLVPGGRNDDQTGSDGPFIGLAVVGTRNPVRFTPTGLERVFNGASSWCETKACTGASTASLEKLEVSEVPRGSVAAAQRALKPMQVPTHQKQPASRPARSIKLFSAGRAQELLVLPFDLSESSSSGVDEITFPGDFLVAQHGREFQHLVVSEGATHGLGEAGDVLAAVDLDGDGSDELLLEWHAGQAYVYRLVRRVGDTLVVLGEYGFGC